MRVSTHRGVLLFWTVLVPSLVAAVVVRGESIYQYPSDDTYVNSARVTKNYSDRDIIRVESAGKIALFRFNFDGITSTIDTIDLEMNVIDCTALGGGASTTMTFTKVDDSSITWTESDATYNSIIPFITTIDTKTVNFDCTGTDLALTLDVTSWFVSRDDDITFIIESDSEEKLDSKESMTIANRPRFAIEATPSEELTTKSPLLIENTGVSSKVQATTSFECVDDASFRHWNNTKRSCEWYSKRKSKRLKQCKKKVMKKACPKTCGICPCTDDLTFEFEKPFDGTLINCAWIATTGKTFLCKRKVDGLFVREFCPAACNRCPAETITKEPTISPTNKPSSTKKKPPNILLILADDVGTGDIPFYWNTSLVDMPNIQRLADMGVTFTNAHSTPLCAPSRYTLLSGNYPHRGAQRGGSWGIRSKSNDGQFLSDQKSIAAVLRDGAGYNTYMSGKYHLGGRIHLKAGATLNDTHILSGKGHDWSKPFIGGPQDLGFDSSLITPEGIQRHPYSFFQDGYLIMDANDAVYWKEGSYDMPMGTSMIIGKNNGEGEGTPDWDSSAYNQILVNDTVRFIDSHLQGDRADDPMFMYVALGAVHIPYSPPNQYMNNVSIAGVNPTAHMDILMEMDLVVGSLVSKIEEEGLANDTIIMFTSDNGGLKESSSDYGHLPSGVLRAGKGTIYEGGHRIPLVIRHDGTYPSNEKRNKLVGLNDVYATLCEIAGVDIPGGSAQDSISFAPYITSTDNVEGLRIGQSTWTNESGNVQGESWQNDEWKVIIHLYQHDNDTFSSNVELYDLKNDISEAYDLSNDDRYNWRIKSMVDNVRSDGPCPKDMKGKFNLTEGPMIGTEKDCDWFDSNHKHCMKYPSDGKTFCSSICGRFPWNCRGYYWLDKHGWGH